LQENQHKATGHSWRSPWERQGIELADGWILLTLDGKLVGPSVGALERTWTRVKAKSGVGISVNLRAVNCISPRGEELLHRVDREEAELKPEHC
jgi:hypothetical protein